MNKQLRFILLSILELLVACLATEAVIAQIKDTNYILFLKTSRLQSYPPLNTGMPFDVVTGYIYLDSLRKQSEISVESVIARMTNSDTLRNALKNIYVMIDHDPIKFMNYRSLPRTRVYQSSGDYLKNLLVLQAAHVLPDTQRTAMICHADIIARVLVTGLESITNTSKGANDGFPNQFIVSCQVIDTIKGRVLPSCSDGYSIKGQSLMPPTSSNCLPFCYSPQEHLSGLAGDVDYGMRHTMTDSVGNPWVKLGGEYIAFLTIDLVGGDSLSIYYTVDLPKAHTTQGSLYRIIDGHVSDPNNDLGFGIYPTTAVFVAGLRSKIYSITHP